MEATASSVADDGEQVPAPEPSATVHTVAAPDLTVTVPRGRPGVDGGGRDPSTTVASAP